MRSSITMSTNNLVKLTLGVAALSFCLGTQLSGHETNQSQAQGDLFNLDNRKFSREETMLLNMTHSKGSVGFLILECLRTAKESTRNMEKALFQLREIEKSYAKSKGQPDTRYLAATELKMVQAKQRSEELEVDTSECFHSLKSSIKDTIFQNNLPLK